MRRIALRERVPGWEAFDPVRGEAIAWGRTREEAMRRGVERAVRRCSADEFRYLDLPLDRGEG